MRSVERKMDYYPGGRMTEYSKVWQNKIHFLPDDIDFEDAVLTEPLCVSVHNVRNTSIHPGQSVVILGLGPIGLLVLRVAQIYGVDKVFGIDVYRALLKMARELGVDRSINAKQEDPTEVIKKETQGG